MARRFWMGPVVIAATVLSAGCAAKGFVREEIQKSREQNRRVTINLLAPAE